MQRNKTIHALGDATVDSGGTSAGAVEQLRKYTTPVYVRSTGAPSARLDALRERGAMRWPNPDGDELPSVLAAVETANRPAQQDLFGG